MKTRSRVTYQTRTQTENHKYDEVQLIEQQPLTILEYLSASLVKKNIIIFNWHMR